CTASLSSRFMFFFSSRRRHTRFSRDWSSDVCSSDLADTSVRTDPHIAQFDADRLVFPLRIRSWRTGDAFHPLGMNGRKKLSDFRSEERRVGKERRSTGPPSSHGNILHE